MNKLDYVIYYKEQNRSGPEADWISFRSFLQSNISILIAGNPTRSDNAWNEDHSENVYAQRSIVKLQAWDSVISIYCLCNTAVVFPLVLNTEVDAPPSHPPSLSPPSLSLPLAAFWVSILWAVIYRRFFKLYCRSSYSTLCSFSFFSSFFWNKHWVTFLHFAYMCRKVCCLTKSNVSLKATMHTMHTAGPPAHSPNEYSQSVEVFNCTRNACTFSLP